MTESESVALPLGDAAIGGLLGTFLTIASIAAFVKGFLHFFREGRKLVEDLGLQNRCGCGRMKCN